MIASRRTRVEDVSAVIALVKRSWIRTYAPLIGLEETERLSDAKHVDDLFLGEIAAPDSVTVVATDVTGRIGGHAGGSLTGDRILYIDRLHVAADLQGQGVAALLLDAAIAQVSGKAKAVELTVLSGNERAFGFYEKYGFEYLDEEAGLGSVPAIRMRHPISVSLTPTS